MASVLLVALAGVVAPVARVDARADGPKAYASSASVRYQVTFAARSCASYADVTAGQVRDDAGETVARPGRDSPYRPGQPVDPAVEDDLERGCTELPGWRFTLGSGHERKGPLSTVTGNPFPTPPTRDWTARLDPAGRDTGGLLAAGVTIWLSDEQARLAVRRQLWVQGATPDRPVQPGYSFGALRCAVDGRTGGNVQWLTFPPGVRHVYCYAYYVKGRTDGRPVTSTSKVDPPSGTALVNLAAGDAVTCTYSMEPPPAAPGLTLRLRSPGATGAFGLTLPGRRAGRR
jgi:hypothetical protein